jgi:hypothetical protein
MGEDIKLQPSFIEFSQDMLDMRDAQNNYFASPTSYNMKLAKQKEAKVDGWLERMIKAGIISHKEKRNTNQLDIFK